MDGVEGAQCIRFIAQPVQEMLEDSRSTAPNGTQLKLRSQPARVIILLLSLSLAVATDHNLLFSTARPQLWQWYRITYEASPHLGEGRHIIKKTTSVRSLRGKYGVRSRCLQSTPLVDTQAPSVGYDARICQLSNAPASLPVSSQRVISYYQSSIAR